MTSILGWYRRAERIHTVNNMSEKNPDGKHAIFKRKLTV